MRRARRLLEAGELVAIFPQGTVLRFKTAASAAAPRGSRSRPASR